MALLAPRRVRRPSALKAVRAVLVLALAASVAAACSRPEAKGAAPAEASAAPAPASVRPRPRASSPERRQELDRVRREIESIVGEMERPRRSSKGIVRPAATVGLVARSLETGESVVAHRASEPRKAASNTKLFSTAAALLRFGADHRFETVFASDAPIERGTLAGDLWVIGGADPTLVTDPSWRTDPEVAFGNVARALAETGIRRVEGSLVLDDRLFVDAPYHPDWPASDRGMAHALDVSALVVEHDRILVTARATAGEIEVTTRPDLAGGRITSTVRVAPGASSIVVHRVSSTDLRVSGTVAPGETARASFPSLEPTTLFGTALLGSFGRSGLTVARGARRPAQGEAAPQRAIARLPSGVPLADVVAVTNRESDNLLAEMLLKLVGARFASEGSFAGGIRVVREVLAELDVPLAGFDAVDGSGLAHTSRVTPACIVALLEAMARTPECDLYRESLAGGGERGGTLRHRFREPSFAGRVRAKTGSLDGVTALSGYVRTERGETIAFSVLSEYEPRGGGSFKPDEDRIVRALASIAVR